MRTDMVMLKRGKYKPRGQHIPFVRGLHGGDHWVIRDSKPRPGPRRIRRPYRKQRQVVRSLL